MAFDPEANRWAHRGRVLNLMFEVIWHSATSGSLLQYNRFVAYDPGEQEGRILSSGLDRGGSFVEDNPIRNLIDPLADAERLSTWDYWTGWDPDLVSISVATHRPGVGFVTRHFGREYLGDRLAFWARRDGYSCAIDPEEVHDLGKNLLAALGAEYVPSPQLKGLPQ